jgi:hypothetical protein
VRKPLLRVLAGEREPNPPECSAGVNLNEKQPTWERRPGRSCPASKASCIQAECSARFNDVGTPFGAKTASSKGASAKAPTTLIGREARAEERFRELVAWYILQGVDKASARRRARLLPDLQRCDCFVRAIATSPLGQTRSSKYSGITSAMPSIATKYRTSRDFGLVPEGHDMHRSINSGGAVAGLASFADDYLNFSSKRCITPHTLPHTPPGR